MSATQDKSQKITFVYSNLYQLYRQGKDAAKSADLTAPLAVPAAPKSGQVLKADDLHQAKIETYSPAELIGKRVARPASLPPKAGVIKPSPAVESLKKNLQTLNDLHSRLKFMLAELEELVKE